MTAPARTSPSGAEVIPTTINASGTVSGTAGSGPTETPVSTLVPVKRGAVTGQLNMSAVLSGNGGGNLILFFLPADGSAKRRLTNWGWSATDLKNWDYQAFFALDAPADGNVQLQAVQSQNTTYSGDFTIFQPRAST